jgi:hypothetical protein
VTVAGGLYPDRATEYFRTAEEYAQRGQTDKGVVYATLANAAAIMEQAHTIELLRQEITEILRGT